MQDNGIVKSFSEEVPEVEITPTVVYIRENIKKGDDGSWSYKETQMNVLEYISLIEEERRQMKSLVEALLPEGMSDVEMFRRLLESRDKIWK